MTAHASRANLSRVRRNPTFFRILAERLPPISPDVLFRRVGDEFVLLNLDTNRIYSLSETGARFWELLHAGESRETIERVLLEEFEVSREQLRAEIDSLTTELAAEGLLDLD